MFAGSLLQDLAPQAHVEHLLQFLLDQLALPSLSSLQWGTSHAQWLYKQLLSLDKEQRGQCLEVVGVN